ncbi:eCIS core domain-containing protein [Streptomyces tubercidicus]|uniref:eCIS core domain-containing protein n=1 Tax=Streptomyces tubercidicus TaxID=47759 RepID=UPI0034663536
MSTSHSATQDNSQATAAEKRRKRRERNAKSRTPEPKDIVSGAGQPLDLSVRRDLEEQLGHDFSQVRLHTDRDSGQLADMMGADAFAVGQDIFFREGTYRPGTADGQRLLAHELLHTVQNPHGLGALRAGRDLGSVSLPQESIEREAESAAQESVLGALRGSAREEPAAEVEEGRATPGWLRYATVDADRVRMEQLDPATLVDRLANDVVRSLRGDPEDRSKRTRMQLARLPDELQDAVLERLESRLLSSERERVLDLVEESEAQGVLGADTAEWAALDAPAVEPDLADDLRTERDSKQRSAEEERGREEKPALAPGPEKDRAEARPAPGSTPRNGGTPQSGSTPQGGGAPRGGQSGTSAGKESGSSAGKKPSGSAGGTAAEEKHSTSSATPESGKEDGQEKSEGGQAVEKHGEGRKDGEDKQSGDGKKSGQDKKDAAGKKGAADKEETEQRETAAASKEESAAKNRPGAAEQLAAGQPAKQEDKGDRNRFEGSPTAGRDTELPSRTSRLDGVRNQDLDGPEETADDDPFGSGSESEVEVGGAEKSAWDTKLQPEDFLPDKDLDVSGVPTAENLEPDSSAGQTVPSFAAPPPTKADKVQAERDAEDAEDEAAEAEPAEAEAADPLESEPSVETEGGPDDAFSGDPDAERLADSRPGAGAPSKDPKAGDDPKAGPVAAQKAVQESPGGTEGGGAEKESAAKEEKGTKADGDKAKGAQEKESQKAPGGKAAAPETAGKGEEPKKDEQKNDGQKKAEPATASESGGDTAGKDDQGQDSKAPSPARDTHVSGGSNADTPGGASNQATSGAQSDTASSQGEQGGQNSASQGVHSQEPKEPAPKEPAKAASTSAPAPAPKEGPQPSQATKKEEPGAKEESGAKSAAPKAAPAPKSPRGGGGGGGGKGAASGKGKGKKKDSGPAPNLSQMSPEAGLSSAAKLKPHKALEAMGGVGGSVDRTVGDEHKQLSSAPPNMQRPAGAPQTLEGKPKADAPAQYSQDPAQKSDAPKDEKAEVKGEKKPEGQIEAEKAEEPSGWDTFKMALGFGVGKLVNGALSLVGKKPAIDEQELAAKFAGLPTKDEALKQAQAGNAPGVNMQGAADEKSGEQGQAVDAKGQEAVTTGRDDAGRPMGENQVYPNAPKEELKGKVPGREGGKGGVRTGKASTGAVPAEAASTVAEHDRKPQFQQAFSRGQKGMSEGHQTKDKGFRESQQKHKQQVAGEVAKNTAEQSGERAKAQSEVTSQRTDWRTSQDEELKKLGTKKTEKREKVRQDVKEREKKTDDDTKKEKEDSDKKIKDKGETAETDAKHKTNTAAKDSGGWITKAFNWIKEKVIEIKNAIVRIIREARDAVVNFIKNFKENAERWINEARKWIVDTVKNLINDLIEFAKNMVKAIIDLANRIRKLITDLIAAAIALVTKLAALLKKIITDLLNRIAKLLSDILNILKKMLMDVIKAVVDAIKTVLEYASKLLGALGEFMMIAIDFMDDPGGWLSGAKNSAVDGAKNHLFREVKNAVKAWFQSKIEEIIGIPKAIIDKLIKGGFTLEKIVKETWDAIVPQLPFIIGEIVITKVIAKLIPGAGWVMAVIDAIRTAIGALSEILRAMGAVLDWLKAVRQGGAGILFAKAVAAGIVALLELAYEALLNGIGKYVAKVGRRLKAVAAKLGKGDKGGAGSKPKAGAGDDKGKEQPKSGKEASPKGDKDFPAATPRPTSTLPKPGKGTGPGTKPNTKAAPKPDPKAPSTKTPDKDASSGKPNDSDKDAQGRPTDDKKPTDKPGQPKDKDGKDAETRPTPTPKPKPKAEPHPRPKSDPDAKPKEKDGKDVDGKPKDDKDAPGKPKEQDPTKPKDPNKPKDKGAQGKPKDDGAGSKKPKDKDRKKPKDDRDGPGKPGRKLDKKGPGKPKPEKSGPGRPKPKPEKDKKKKNEDSKEPKEERLRKIVARIRPQINTMLRRGLPEPVLKTVLSGWRAWYRLTSLSMVGTDDFSLIARLNPEAEVTKAHFELFDIGDEDAVAALIRNRIKAKLPKEPITVFKDAKDICDKAASDVLQELNPKNTSKPKSSPRVAKKDKKKGNDQDKPIDNGKPVWEPDYFPDEPDLQPDRYLFSLARNRDKNPRWSIAEFRKQQKYEEDLRPIKRKGDQTLYTDKLGREFVKARDGVFVPRKIQRNINAADLKRGAEPKGPGLVSKIPKGKAKPDIGKHIQGAPSPFISTTQTDAGKITNSNRKESLGGEHGRITIDLLQISPKNIFDATRKVTQNNYQLAPATTSAKEQRLQDAIRTQEVLIWGEIPGNAIVEFVSADGRKMVRLKEDGSIERVNK